MPTAILPPKLHIPAIDLSPDSGKSDEDLAATLLEALFTVGFLYVLNPGPGLTTGHVRDMFEVAERLFAIPLEEKEAVVFDKDVGAGYTPMMGQTTGVDPNRFRGDLKESFSIGPNTTTSLPKSTYATDIITKVQSFRRAAYDCSQRLLELFSVALKTPNGDKNYFTRRHTWQNNETLRIIHYPSFPKAEDEADQGKETSWENLKVGSKDIRAGAHQDFGSATLLFQSPPDENGKATAVQGLEIFVAREDGPDVLNEDGSGRRGWWIPAPAPEGSSLGGSALVNVGVAMEIWSGEQFTATWHRVTVPPPTQSAVDGQEILPGRKSIVFHSIPDHNVVLTPIDASGVPSVAEGCMTCGEFFKKRIARTYAYGKA
ncbi:hypothetical protein BCR39DRAFT_589499 [Naematelia encephala]|uniref:Fe2OG dioxygenase domain-containing protein n=1 Tax=Naematelia encephala TaxID=71784 RepID=A0A1Y2AW54_9TREE|nr:hypothetical protein BCR39DRAFT_589499 [Naematelia encephala]